MGTPQSQCRMCHTPFPPNVATNPEGRRICPTCGVNKTRLCEHCRLRPVPRKTSSYCSKACSNAARAVPLHERFAAFYKEAAPDVCWTWNGPRDANGYGVITDEKRKQFRAHRIAYERAHGPIPNGKNVLHRCDNPPCVNPSHLFPGTAGDNSDDKVNKRRHAHGDTHPMRKLSAADVLQIRVDYAAHGNAGGIAERHGVKAGTVYDVVYKRNWKHV